jgi:hypothetical protein
LHELDALFLSLGRSHFRAQFHLSSSEKSYLQEQTLPVILLHANQFVVERFVPERPLNDGTQTPLRGHPVFVAQPATATCCRRCLSEWHRIAPGVALNDEQIAYVIEVLEIWLKSQIPENSSAILPEQGTLFPE